MSSLPDREHGTVRVFLLNLYDLDEMAYKKFYEAISPKRRERADRYCRQEDAVRCVMSEMLVRYVYFHIKKNTKLPEFVYPFRGKPYLSNDLAFHFSVSHAGMFIAVGYAQEEIGIDLEQINRSLNRESIAAFAFTPEEQSYIFGTYGIDKQRNTDSESSLCFGETNSMLRFAQLWTAKESYLKYLGCGFGKSPLSFSVNLEERAIYEKEGGLVPGISVFGNCLTEEYYLTACGKIEKVSLEYVTYHSIMDTSLQ